MIADINFGVQLGGTNPRRWPELAECADALGFESVWIPEHLVIPESSSGSPYAQSGHPPVPSALPILDPMVVLGHLAGRTSRIKLGTNVYNIGLRHPFVTARAVATIDVLSQGRMLLGVGASWLRAEWEALGLDFDTRGARVDEAIEVCRRLWTEPVTEYHGRFFDFGPSAFEPKPVQSPVPLHIGGDGPAALRRVAQVGAGWMPMNHKLDELPSSLATIGRLARDRGRTAPVELTLNATPEARPELDPYVRAGVTRLIVKPWTRSAHALPAMRAFAEAFLTPPRNRP